MKKTTWIILTLLLIASVSAYEIRDIGSIYTDKQVMIDQWKTLCDKSNQCEYEVAGTTWQDNDITLFKIGNPNGGTLFFDGSIHGPEDATTELEYLFVKWLFESDDDRAKRILSRNYLLVMPIVNMDSSKRQNGRRVLPDGSPTKGVDLNRNFEAGWGEGVTDPYSIYYIGPYANSEPETNTIISVIEQYNPKLYLNTHNGGAPRYLYWEQNEISDKVLELIDKYTPDNVERYTMRYIDTIKSGFAAQQAHSMGVSAWVTETCSWAELPKYLPDLIDNFYERNFPIFISMCEAVEIVEEPPIVIDKELTICYINNNNCFTIKESQDVSMTDTTITLNNRNALIDLVIKVISLLK